MANQEIPIPTYFFDGNELKIVKKSGCLVIGDLFCAITTKVYIAFARSGCTMDSWGNPLDIVPGCFLITRHAHWNNDKISFKGNPKQFFVFNPHETITVDSECGEKTFKISECTKELEWNPIPEEMRDVDQLVISIKAKLNGMGKTNVSMPM
jgi:hypothetical protein